MDKSEKRIRRLHRSLLIMDVSLYALFVGMTAAQFFSGRYVAGCLYAFGAACWIWMFKMELDCERLRRETMETLDRIQTKLALITSGKDLIC